MTYEMTDQLLLLVFGEPSSVELEAELNDWYDNEHAPARLTVPGITTAARYKATDVHSPSWIAVFDVASPDVLRSEAYQAQRSNVSLKEASIAPRLTTFQRAVYSNFTTVQNPSVTSSSLPGKFLVAAAVNPSSAEIEDGQNRGYAEEHLSLLSKVPGFLRARRFKLVNHGELSGNADRDSIKPPPKYIYLYNWDRDTFVETQEFKNAMLTQRIPRIRAPLLPEVRVYTLLKNISK